MLALGMLALGCDSSPKTYRLAGEVTFAGKPVPKGWISLEPDAAKGNRGPAVIAPIVDGRYNTPAKEGVLGEAYIARVRGYDGVRDAKGELPDGRELFPEREVPLDLPKADADFPIVLERR